MAISAMNSNASGTPPSAVRPEAGDQADDEHQQCPECIAIVAPPSVRPTMIVQPRHRRDERLLQEAELPVPEQADAGEDRREQDRHPDDAGRDELQVAALPGFLEDRAQAEPEHQQIQQRLAERRDDLRARARDTASPRAARGCRSTLIVIVLHISRHLPHLVGRRSARSSRIVVPVSARNARFERVGAGLLLQLLRRALRDDACRDR